MIAWGGLVGVLVGAVDGQGGCRSGKTEVEQLAIGGAGSSATG